MFRLLTNVLVLIHVKKNWRSFFKFFCLRWVQFFLTPWILSIHHFIWKSLQPGQDTSPSHWFSSIYTFCGIVKFQLTQQSTVLFLYKFPAVKKDLEKNNINYMKKHSSARSMWTMIVWSFSPTSAINLK